MRFSDFLNPKTGPEALIRLALYPLLILVLMSLVVGILSRLRAVDLLLAFLLLVFLSPLAYLAREHRSGRGRQPRTRHGAERTPLLPQEEEDE